MSKELPSIDDDLAPRRRVDLRAIQPRKQADQLVEENSRLLGDEWGAHTSLTRPVVKTPLASLRIEVPDYLDRELAVRAAEQRVTKQYLVMKALQEAGYRIDSQDLVMDKRKVKR